MTGTDLAVQETDLAPVTLFGTDNPSEVVERAAKVARTLEEVVRSQNLVVRIGQGEHVRVEGWTFLGTMLGVFPVVEWTRPIVREEIHVGWEARVIARTKNGEVVGAGEAECLTSERTWKSRDDYALRSMAQTRAVSKALRLPLGFVMQLAGFNPTPAEEMPVIEGSAGEPTGGSAPADAGTSVSEPPVSQTDAGTSESASPAADHLNDPDIPFGDAAVEGVNVPERISEQQKKKLDVLVKADLKDHIKVDHLYTVIAQTRGWTVDELVAVTSGRKQDGTLSWARLRDALTKAEAHGIIDRLEVYARTKGKAA